MAPTTDFHMAASPVTCGRKTETHADVDYQDAEEGYFKSARVADLEPEQELEF